MAKAETDDAIIAEAKARFARCESWESKARANALLDSRFANGDSYNLFQWDQGVLQARGDRPCLTQNKARQHNLHIVNDARQHKAAIKVTPTGGGATFEAAEIFSAVIRRIEYQSKAMDAYSTAIYHQVESGIGYVRVVTDYADEDSFDQEIFIRRIKDPRTVYLDPDAQEYDKGDMRYAFCFTNTPRAEFAAKYPDANAEAGPTLDYSDDWDSKEHVREAEYWRRGEKDDKLHLLADGSTVRESAVPPEARKSLQIVKTRAVAEPEIEWFQLAGGKIVDRKTWPGRYIPLVPFIGEEIVIDGQMDRKGHTRALIDAQKMYNYWNPLSLDTPLPTPSGWTTMGAVNAGDWLLDEKGAPCQVAGVSPVHINRDCYWVEFDDGSHIVADAEHPWTVEVRGKRGNPTWDWSTQTIPTRELTPNKHFIHTALPLELPEIELPIHPYLLGAWLGDGKTTEPMISAGKNDAEEMREILLSCGCDVGIARYYGANPGASITVHRVRAAFSALGLLGNKHIPEIYLRASREQRMALLQGLMDTDGSITKAINQCSFTTTSPAIAEGMAELLRTLGIKAVSCTRTGRITKLPQGGSCAGLDHVQFSFSADPQTPVFKLKRKAALQSRPRTTHTRRTKRHRILFVEAVKSVPVKCVTINSESHLFLAGPGMVPTHNSAAVEQVALQGKSPYIGPLRAFEGLDKYWNQANTQNFPYLPYNDVDVDSAQPIQRPERSQPPQMAQAYLQGMQTSANDMMMVSGQYQAEMGAPGNERSGVAIQQRQREGDTATYHYIDNQAKGIRQIGRIVLDLIPKIYDVARVIKIMAADGTQSDVDLDPAAPQAHKQVMPGPPGQPPQPVTPEQADAAQNDPQQPDPRTIFNPTVGRYDVEADVGPAFGTQREEAFNAIQQVIQASPDLVHVAGDLLFKSADFPLADELAERLKRGVPPQYLGGPSPQVMQLQQQVQQTQQHGQAMAQQADAEVARLKAEIVILQEQAKDKSGRTSIDDYKAETDRLAAVTVADPMVGKVLVRSMLSGLIGMPALPILQAHAAADAQHAAALAPLDPDAINGAAQANAAGPSQ